MSVTGFLSLWISNVASASMMLPIVIAMVKELAKLDSTFKTAVKRQSISLNAVGNHGLLKFI